MELRTANHSPDQVSGSEDPDSGGTGVHAPWLLRFLWMLRPLRKLMPFYQCLSLPFSLNSPSPIPQRVPQSTCPSRKTLSASWLKALAHSVLWVSFPDLPSEEDFAESPGFIMVAVSSSCTCKRTHISSLRISRYPYTNTLMPHLCPSPISGKNTYNVCNPDGRDQLEEL